MVLVAFLWLIHCSYGMFLIWYIYRATIWFSSCVYIWGGGGWSRRKWKVSRLLEETRWDAYHSRPRLTGSDSPPQSHKPEAGLRRSRPCHSSIHKNLLHLQNIQEKKKRVKTENPPFFFRQFQYSYFNNIYRLFSIHRVPSPWGQYNSMSLRWPCHDQSFVKNLWSTFQSMPKFLGVPF